MLTDGRTLNFFVHGRRTRTVNVIPPLYDNLKAVAHVPFTLWLLLHRCPEDVAERLESLVAAWKLARGEVADLFAECNAATRGLQSQLLTNSIEFAERVGKAGGRVHVDPARLEEFSRAQAALVRPNIALCAQATLDVLFRETKHFRETVSKREWSESVAVVMGPKLPRRGYLATQFFARLLGVSGEDDQRLVFVENVFSPDEALRVLATSVTDTAVGEAFFQDASAMHADITADAAHEHLKTLFPPIVLRAALAQVVVLRGDSDGNMRRIRYAAKDAARAGASVLLLPDACTEPGVVDRLQSVATEFELAIVGGVAGTRSSTRQAVVISKVGAMTTIVSPPGPHIIIPTVMLDDQSRLGVYLPPAVNDSQPDFTRFTFAFQGQVGESASDTPSSAGTPDSTRPDILVWPVSGNAAFPEGGVSRMARRLARGTRTSVAAVVSVPSDSNIGTKAGATRQPEDTCSVAVTSTGGDLRKPLRALDRDVKVAAFPIGLRPWAVRWREST
jgi:hypothetical protein